MLTSEQIANAKNGFAYHNPKDIRHEHDDCIRIAYAWLDAQKKLRGLAPKSYLALKHIIEKWGGRYVSQDDVEVAAFLHPGVKGNYPNFNLSTKRVLPSFARLEGIGQANSMPNYRQMLDKSAYKSAENGM